MRVRGKASTGQVWIGGGAKPRREVLPKNSQRYRNHSPDGFAWGYGGSGPAQLALALCLRIFNHRRAPDAWEPLPFDYQAFKWNCISTLEFGQDFDFDIDVDATIKEYARPIPWRSPSEEE